MKLRRTDSGGFPLGSDAAAILSPLLDPAFPVPGPLDFPLFSLCPPERAEAHSLACLGPRTRLTVREAWSLPANPRPALIAAETGVFLPFGPPPAGPPVLRVRSAHAAVALLLDAWSARWEREVPFAMGPGNRVALSACVEGILEGNVEVSPGAYVAAGAFIGAGSRIGANAVIEANVVIGRDCVVQPGAVIGCAGFGFAPGPARAGNAQSAGGARGEAARGAFVDGSGLVPLPHPAGVRIGDECFIGANSVIAAGVLHPTALGRGCKLDSHVQVAHNVVLGDGCLLASQSGLAGSTVAGNRLRLGGAASVDGHLRLGDDVSVAACSGVTKDLPDGSVVAGFPARPIDQWRKQQVGKRRIGEAG